MSKSFIEIGIFVFKIYGGKAVSHTVNKHMEKCFDRFEDEVYPKNIFGKRKLCKELRKK